MEHWKGKWPSLQEMLKTTGIDCLMKRKILCPCRNSNLNPSAVQPVAWPLYQSRYLGSTQQALRSETTSCIFIYLQACVFYSVLRLHDIYVILFAAHFYFNHLLPFKWIVLFSLYKVQFKLHVRMGRSEEKFNLAHLLRTKQMWHCTNMKAAAWLRHSDGHENWPRRTHFINFVRKT